MSEKEELLASALERVEHYLDGVEKLASEHASEAVDLGLLAARIDAAASVIPATIFFLVLIVATICFYKELRVGLEYDKGKYTVSNKTVITSFGLPISVLLLLVSAAAVFNIWGWVGIFIPEAYLVRGFLP